MKRWFVIFFNNFKNGGNKNIRKKVFFFIAFLFLSVSSSFFAPFSLFATENDSLLKANDSFKTIDYCESASSVDVSAFSVLSNDLIINNCKECIEEYTESEESYKMEYGIFMIACLVFNGGALGMVIISELTKRDKDKADD